MMFNKMGTYHQHVHFVSDPAGNCGYNLPYAGVAIAMGCGGPSDHTWAHEVITSVQHPSWDGNGVSHDGSIAHNFSDPPLYGNV